MQFEVPQVPRPDFAGTVRLSRIRVSGLSSFDPAELQEVLAPWVGREVTADELAGAARAATERLHRRGLFVAVAYFPPAQDFGAGEAELLVVEGRVGRVAIEVDPAVRIRRSVVEDTLAPIRPGMRIARGEFDTPLLLLNDLPGAAVWASLSPGAEAGALDLHARVQDQPLLGIQLRVDNHEIREYGRTRYTGNVRLRSPLGLGDLAVAEYSRSDTAGDELTGFSYSLPLNARGTRVGARYREQDLRLGGQFAPLGYSAEFERSTFTVEHAALRSHDRNLVAALAYDHVRFEERIAAVGVRNDVRQRFVTASALADWRDYWLREGRTAIRLEHQRGRVDFDTPAAAAADAAGLRQNGEFNRTRLRIETARRLEGPIVLAAVEAQMASRNLHAGREIYLSGPYGVRAYPYEELVADEGRLFTLESRWPLPVPATVQARGGVFFDWASGTVDKRPAPGGGPNRRTLAGVGVTAAVEAGEGFDASLTAAWATRGVSRSDPERRPRWWFLARQAF